MCGETSFDPWPYILGMFPILKLDDVSSNPPLTTDWIYPLLYARFPRVFVVKSWFC